MNEQLKGRETAQDRVRRLVTVLNAAMMLDPAARIVSHGTRVEVRPSGGHYHDAGLDAVAEFHRAFNCHIAPDPSVPDYGPIAEDFLRSYCQIASGLAKDLQTQAAEVLEYNDEAGALLLIRLQLCQEELAELAEAMLERDIIGCLDALTDMSYVGDGTYLTLGLGHYKLAALAEVHSSNMSKLGEDGEPVIADSGRVMKGPNYRRPDLASVLGMEGE